MEISAEILNKALSFSMEFGENWLKDIHARLQAAYPQLKPDEVDYCNRLCKKVNKLSHDLVLKNPIKVADGIRMMDLTELKAALDLKYAWINEANLSAIHSQSCYYALK